MGYSFLQIILCINHSKLLANLKSQKIETQTQNSFPYNNNSNNNNNNNTNIYTG